MTNSSGLEQTNTVGNVQRANESVSDIMEFSDLVGLSSWKDVQHKNNYR